MLTTRRISAYSFVKIALSILAINIAFLLTTFSIMSCMVYTLPQAGVIRLYEETGQLFNNSLLEIIRRNRP